MYGVAQTFTSYKALSCISINKCNCNLKNIMVCDLSTSTAVHSREGKKNRTKTNPQNSPLTLEKLGNRSGWLAKTILNFSLFKADC